MEQLLKALHLTETAARLKGFTYRAGQKMRKYLKQIFRDIGIAEKKPRWTDMRLNYQLTQRTKHSMLPKYDMKWTPAGSSKTSRNSVSGLVKETWKDADDVSFEWLYSRNDLACPARTPESVTVNGAKAKYWKGNPDGGFDINWGDEQSHVYTQEQKNLLVWTDSKANITFRIIGMMDKDEMIKMAESVVVK